MVVPSYLYQHLEGIFWIISVPSRRRLWTVLIHLAQRRHSPVILRDLARRLPPLIMNKLYLNTQAVSIKKQAYPLYECLLIFDKYEFIVYYLMIPQDLQNIFGLKDQKDLNMANNIWKMLD